MCIMDPISHSFIFKLLFYSMCDIFMIYMEHNAHIWQLRSLPVNFIPLKNKNLLNLLKCCSSFTPHDEKKLWFLVCFCVFLLPGKAVRMVPRTNAPANISADTSSVMSPEEEKGAGRHRGEENIHKDKHHPDVYIWGTHPLKYLHSAQSVKQSRV